MKIHFIQIPHPAYTERNLPLAPAILKASLLSLKYAESLETALVNNRRFDRQGCRSILEQIISDRPDMICFSLYMWNLDRSLYLIRRIKSCLPQTIIVAGGPEIEPGSNIFSQEMGIDFAVIGEGEEPLKDILDIYHWPAKDIETIPGIGYRFSGKYKFNCLPRRGCDINKTPSPLLLEYYDISDYQELMIFIMRGCLQSCSYCTWSARGRLRAYGIDRLKQELGYIYDKTRALGQKKIVSICDSAFNTSPVFKSYCEAISEINKDNLLEFRCFVQADLIDDPAARLLKKAKFTSVEIGLQSVHPAILKNVNRVQQPDAFLKGLSILKQYEIPLIVDTILGLPGDSLEGFGQTMAFVEKKGLRPVVFNLSLTGKSLLKKKKNDFGIHAQVFPPYYVVHSNTFPRKVLLQALEEYQEYSADFNPIHNLGFPLLGIAALGEDVGIKLASPKEALRCHGPVTAIVVTLPDARPFLSSLDLPLLLSSTMGASPKVLIRFSSQEGQDRDVHLLQAVLERIAVENKYLAWDIFVENPPAGLVAGGALAHLHQSIARLSNPFLNSLDALYPANTTAIRRRGCNLIAVFPPGQPGSRNGEMPFQTLSRLCFRLEDANANKLKQMQNAATDNWLIDLQGEAGPVGRLEGFMKDLSDIWQAGKQVFFMDWVLQRWWEQEFLKIRPVRQERCEVSIDSKGVVARSFSEKDLYWDSVARWKLLNTPGTGASIQQTLIHQALLRLPSHKGHH